MRFKKCAAIFILFIIATMQACNQAPAKKPVFVIVHGAWGGGWAFKKVDSLLTEKGCIIYRPTLTGQGERVHLYNEEVGLQTHIDDIVNTILFENLHDVILVGHSYGGMVVTGVADSIPDRIKEIIYVDAFLPDSGDNVSSQWNNHTVSLDSISRDGILFPPWLKPGSPLPHDVPQPLKTFTDKIVLKHPSPAVPAIYILTVAAGTQPGDDDFAPQAAKARKKGIKVLQLQAEHNPQWSAPEAFAEMLYQNR